MPESASLSWRAENTINVDENSADTLFKLLSALDDCDDVQQVSANFDVSDDILSKLSN